MFKFVVLPCFDLCRSNSSHAIFPFVLFHVCRKLQQLQAMEKPLLTALYEVRSD